MTFLELIHRILEQNKRFISRFYIPRSIKYFNNSKSLPKFLGYYADLDIFKNDYKLLKEWRTFSYHITKNEFMFFGVKWPNVNLDDIWHLDPITKKNWPVNIYCFDIHYRDTDEYGDIKFAWELNRLQFLQPDRRLDGDQRLGRWRVGCNRTMGQQPGLDGPRRRAPPAAAFR